MDDPHDSIESFNDLQLWCCPEDFGILMCMWTGTIPAIALPNEPWRGGLDYLTASQKNRRIVDYRWNRELRV